MSEKARIVAALGELRLLLPYLLNEALAANERAKYRLTLLQTAKARADSPDKAFSDLRTERPACGIYSESLQEEILAMPAGFLGRYLRYSDRMEVHGPDLGMPHTRAMGDGLFELRLKAAEGIARVFCCTVVGRKIVMLHQFIKKTDKTPAKELATAQRRMKEINK